MIIILGLVILVAAGIAGVTGVLANGGHAHAVTHFAVFGYHVTGSTGTLFLYGIVTGALALAGLSLLLAGARRTSRRGRAARQSLRQSRRETAAVSQDRDDLIGQRDTARAYTVHDEQRNFTASTLGNGDGNASPGPAATPGRAGRACSRAGPPGGQKRCPARPPRPPPPRPPPARPRPRNDPRRTAPHEYRQEDRAQGRGSQRRLQENGRAGHRQPAPARRGPP
jgi:hypothetical protein